MAKLSDVNPNMGEYAKTEELYNDGVVFDILNAFIDNGKFGRKIVYMIRPVTPDENLLRPVFKLSLPWNDARVWMVDYFEKGGELIESVEVTKGENKNGQGNPPWIFIESEA